MRAQFKRDFFADIILPVFRATAIAWSCAIHLDQTLKASSAASNAASNAANAAAGSDVAVAASNAADAAASAAAAAYYNATAATLAKAATGVDDAFAAYVSAAYASGYAADAFEKAGWPAERFWAALSVDATRLNARTSSNIIAGWPLWSGDQPKGLPLFWRSMRDGLVAANQNWEVWTEWYEARLAGKPFNKRLETARATIPNEIWDQGPAVVNAEVKRQIEEIDQRVRETRERTSLPKIPPPRPAAIEPVWSNGILVLPSNPAKMDGNIDALSAALKVLRAELTELADDLDAEPGNFDKRAIIYLRRNAARIPDMAPPQDDLFRLAHAKEYFQAYTKTANEVWPDHLATRFETLTRHFDRVVRQFPGWRAFVRNSDEDHLTTEQIAEIPVVAEAVVEFLSSVKAREFVDPAIPAVLNSLAVELHAVEDAQEQQDKATVAELLEEDVLESMNNIFKALASKLVASLHGISSTANEAVAEFSSEARKSVVDEARTLGKGTGPALTKWTKRILLGGSVVAGGKAAAPGLAAVLIHAFPDKFGWLQSLITLFP